MEFKAGEKVSYCVAHGPIEKGIIKRINENMINCAFVVYNCGGDWDNYKNYTAANTNFRDLKPGWDAYEKYIADKEWEEHNDRQDEYLQALADNSLEDSD